MSAQHTEDCYGDEDECRPIDGDWNQPDGTYVDLAAEELGEDAPWCAVHHRAWELIDSDVDPS